MMISFMENLGITDIYITPKLKLWLSHCPWCLCVLLARLRASV